MYKVYLYVDPASEAEIVKEMKDAYDRWNSRPFRERPAFASYNDSYLRHDENGLGIELRQLPFELPFIFRDLEPTTVTIEDEYLEDDGLLRAGKYHRKEAIAVVTRRVARGSANPNGFVQYAIRVKGERLAAIRLYTSIKGGKTKPTTPWEVVNEQ